MTQKTSQELKQELFVVEVAYALPDKQKIIEMRVSPGTTALQAVRQSGITEHFSEIDLDTAVMGIFGQTLGSKGLAPASAYVLQPHDRVEIYRPLLIDPKEIRKQRAEKAKRGKQ